MKFRLLIPSYFQNTFRIRIQAEIVSVLCWIEDFLSACRQSAFQSQAVAVSLWSPRQKAWSLWEEPCGKGVQPWQPATVTQHSTNESQLNTGKKRRLQPPRIETHRQIVLKVSAARQSAADTSHGLKDKAFFVVDPKLQASGFFTNFYISEKNVIRAILLHWLFLFS